MPLQSMNEKISAFLSERIAANDFPSAVYLVAEKGEIVYHEALGNAVVTPEVIPARLDTIYDLASLTKPLVTGLLTAVLADRNEINVDWIICNYLDEFNAPELSGSFQWDSIIYELASHGSGFPAWRPFYLLVNDRSEILKEIAHTPLEINSTVPVVYSDLNFLILTFLIDSPDKFPGATH